MVELHEFLSAPGPAGTWATTSGGTSTLALALCTVTLRLMSEIARLSLCFGIKLSSKTLNIVLRTLKTPKRPEAHRNAKLQRQSLNGRQVRLREGASQDTRRVGAVAQRGYQLPRELPFGVVEVSQQQIRSVGARRRSGGTLGREILCPCCRQGSPRFRTRARVGFG